MLKNVLPLLLLYVSMAHAQVDNAGSGRAIRFDGVDDYVDLGNIYDNIALPITISVWVYIEPASGQITFPIFDSQDNSLVYNGFGMNVYATPRIGIFYGDGQGGNNPAFRKGRVGDFKFLTGRWINVTGIMRSISDMDVYLNGYKISGPYEGSSSLPMNSNSPSEVARIGKLFSNGLTYHFKGLMDELRIWNRSLTEVEIQQQMCSRLNGNETGLIGYWNFDETSGNVVNDKSLNHFNGQMMGNPTRVFSGAPVGDQSVYLYTDNWTAKTFSMSDGKDKIEVSGITSDPFGVHIFEVKNTPSQKDGLPSGITQPYFGVFAASDNVNTTFDIQYLVGGLVSCDLFSRTDNSKSFWATETSALSDFFNRMEFIKGSNANNAKVDLGKDQSSCSFQPQVLTPVSDPAGLEFTWQDGSTQPTFAVSDFGVYWVTVKNECGSVTDSIKFSKTSKNILSIDLGKDQTSCSVTSQVLTPVSDPAGLEFIWQDGSTQPAFTVSDFGIYWVTVKSACDIVTDSIRFSKININLDSIPNIVTANGDHLNDHFVIDKRLQGQLSILILNRWGKEVYKAKHYANEWGGEDVSGGIYFYILSGACLNRKGTIHLLK